MKSRKLQFEGAGGDRLVGRLDLPPDEAPFAYALFAHCFTCSRDLKAAVNLSRALTAERVAVFRFDFTGLGESEGEFADTGFSSNVEDLVADEPREAGGRGSGPSPYDLLTAALGACTAMTLRTYADRKGWPLEATGVRLRHRKCHATDGGDCPEGDPRLDQIERALSLEGPLDDGQKARLVEIATRCPVHRTLEAGVRLLTRLEPEAPGPDAEAADRRPRARPGP